MENSEIEQLAFQGEVMHLCNLAAASLLHAVFGAISIRDYITARNLLNEVFEILYALDERLVRQIDGD
jgi:hypothetical protein